MLSSRQEPPRDVRIGIADFASTALLVQSPAIDHNALNSAIARFELQRGTAVGSRILMGLSNSFPQEDFPINQSNSRNFLRLTMRAQLDEEALKQIADMTRARYFHATSAEDLKAVYTVLSRQLVVETREMEITDFFAFLAALAMLVAVGLSLAWYHRIA